MNIWGLQQQIKQIIITKKEYLKRPRKERNDTVVKNFDLGIANRKNTIKELRRKKPKKDKKLKRKR